MTLPYIKFTKVKKIDHEMLYIEIKAETIIDVSAFSFINHFK